MRNKVEQLNQAYKKALASVIIKETPESGNISVRDVLLDPSLKHGRVWLQTDLETFNRIKEKRVEIQNSVSRYVKIRYTPVLEFVLDEGYLDHMDELFKKIEDEN